MAGTVRSYGAPISPSVPLVLAPSSRPSSPTASSNISESEHISLLAARLSDLDQVRRRLGPNHLGTWAAGLGGLESTVLKGSHAESPWARKPGQTPHETDAGFSRGIPINMAEWRAWESQEAESKRQQDSDRRAETTRTDAKLLKHRKTDESIRRPHSDQLARQEEEKEEKKTSAKDFGPPIASHTSRDYARRDRSITKAFVASKPTVSASASAAKPILPPRRTTSRSFPSLETLNSAARTPSPVEESGAPRESWRSREGGAEEEVLFEIGCTQTVLPTSTQNPPSSLSPRPSAKRQQFFSSPTSLPPQRAGLVRFTSTPLHRRLDPDRNLSKDRSTANAEDGSRSDQANDKPGPKPKLHRLSSMDRVGSTASLKGDAEAEGREIEEFLGRDHDSLDSR